jgi:Flp pilus assembly protein TadG
MAALNIFRRRPRRGDRGAELVELAIVLPILLLVLASIIDFGFLFQQWESVTNAAREGARLATLPGYTAADVKARVGNYLSATGMAPARAVIPDPTFSTQTLPSGMTVSVATVNVWYPADFRYLGPIAALVGGTSQSSIMMRAVSVMRVEAAAGGS